MNFLKNLEARIESLVEGTFRSAFKSEVQPVELARRLAKEMDANKTASVARTYAPNEYRIFLSPDDRAHFEGYEEGLKKELSVHLLEHARRRGYSLISRPSIDFETDDQLEMGQFGIQARMVDAQEEADDAVPGADGHTMVFTARSRPEREPAVSESTDAVLIAGDRRYALSGSISVIGRGRECDITLPDPNISRRHAEIKKIGNSWALEDLGSTNGTKLDGMKVNGQVPLQPGDNITVGSTQLLFETE